MLSPELLLAFTETAKRQSFADAARELGTAPSTTAKSVARLEHLLGLRLFHRTTRRVTLTPDGERFYERCSRLVAELRELESEATGVSAKPVGTLRVDLPVVFGRELVVPALLRLVRRHPDVELDVRFSDAFVDLVKEGIDLAVRIGELPDSSLVARQIGSQDWILCASPNYLASRGHPETPADLQLHQAILFRMPTTGRDQLWQIQEDGEQRTLRQQGRFKFSDGEAMVRFAEHGFGIAQLPDYMISRSLAAGALVEVLPTFRARRAPIYAVMPANRMIPARVRVALEELDALPNACPDTRRQVAPSDVSGIDS